jgi:hypothetical protein
MLRQVLLVAVIAVAALIPLGAHADEKLVLKSVTADLPFGDRMFPDGPGSEAVNNNCLACHSAGMVLTQPALSNGTPRSKRCARRTRRRSIRKTSTQLSTISSDSVKRSEQSAIARLKPAGDRVFEGA